MASPVLLGGAGLWPDGTGGFRDKDANAVFRLPHFAEPGPATLLIRKEWLVQRLSDIGKRLVWTVLGEQQEINGGFNSRGRSYNAYSRAHRLWGEKVQKADPILSKHRPEPVASIPALPAPDGNPDHGE